ncbi:hypothetical protein B7P43_G13279 [Cryptotermes secundus]|uniref:Uncharacterized protein n=1 Tax=Cryptotermes secundus TaxID=105785 RepID=A0A2J7PE09_9NEOP|nr:hypothetical protein B7P43_G13279 [Cryptotermes secundus]
MANQDIKIGKTCFANVAQFRYFGTTIRNRNVIEEEIKRTLNSGNACETWSLTLRVEHRLRVFENRVLRRDRR